MNNLQNSIILLYKLQTVCTCVYVCVCVFVCVCVYVCVYVCVIPIDVDTELQTWHDNPPQCTPTADGAHYHEMRRVTPMEALMMSTPCVC